MYSYRVQHSVANAIRIATLTASTRNPVNGILKKQKQPRVLIIATYNHLAIE